MISSEFFVAKICEVWYNTRNQTELHMNDYGHIADGVPSFAISLYKEYRNFGIGTRLMETMLMELKGRGYNRTSLAVQKANYAVRMYKKVGFEIFDENDEEYIMVCELKNI